MIISDKVAEGSSAFESLHEQRRSLLADLFTAAVFCLLLLLPQIFLTPLPGQLARMYGYLLCCCWLPLYLIVVRTGFCVRGWRSLPFVFFGMLFYGVGYIFWLKAGLSGAGYGHLLLFPGLCALCLFLAGLLRPSLLFRQISKNATTLFPGRGALLAVFCLLLFLAPYFFMYIHSGSGALPEVFYAEDNTFHLGQVHSLLQAETYPPHSLAYAGFSRAYHYGAQASAAAAGLFSGLPAHVAYFGIFGGCTLLTLMVLLLAFGGSFSRVPLFFSSLLPAIFFMWNEDTGAIIRDLFLSFYFQDPSFSRFYNLVDAKHLVTLSGFALLVAFVVVHRKAQRPSSFAVQSLLVFLALFIKVHFFVALGALLAGAVLLDFMRHKEWKPVLTCFLAMAISLATYKTLHTSQGVVHFDFSPGGILYLILHEISVRGENLFKFCFNFINNYIIVLMCLLLMIQYRARFRFSDLLPGTAGLVGLFSLIGLEHSIFGDYNFSLYSPLTPFLEFMIGFYVLFCLDKNHGKALVRPTFFMALAIAVPLGVQALFTGFLFQDPSRGFEYVSNRDIIPALEAVPVENTLLVTNDLHYPANEFDNGGAQFQLPAVFGHATFASNIRFIAMDDVEQRRKLQQLLAAENWSPAIEKAARKHGWTHYLVRKAAPHPGDIPLRRVFSNPQYDVYVFPEYATNS